MSIRSLSFTLTFAVALGGCAPQPEATGAQAAAAASAVSRNFFVDHGITEVRYVKVAMHDPDPRPETVMRLPNVASRRTELLAKADVGSWQREYVDDRVNDGMRWVVEFVCRGEVIKRVDGFNAEPEGLKYLLQACGVRRSDPRQNFRD